VVGWPRRMGAQRVLPGRPLADRLAGRRPARRSRVSHRRAAPRAHPRAAAAYAELRAA
jgi:hypothetical protein